MINNIKEIIKKREQHENKNDTNILNKLDQEIINNLKIKILSFETENLKLTDELNSIKRNFEALCSKNKEDSIMIKKLDEEIIYLKNKIKSIELIKMSNNSNITSNYEEEKNLLVRNYDEKIDQLNLFIKNLESKLNNYPIKLMEKDTFYKGCMSKIEDKNKNLIYTHENLKVENKNLKNEILKIKNKNEESERQINEYTKDIEKLNTYITNFNKSQTSDEKVRKEKDLIEKLLIESRERIKQLELNEKKNNKLYEKRELLISELNYVIKSSEDKIESQINYIEKLTEDLTIRKTLKLNMEIEHIEIEYKFIKSNIIPNTVSLEVTKGLISNFNSAIYNIFNMYSKLLSNKLIICEDKLNKFQYSNLSSITCLINVINKNKNNIISNEEKSSELLKKIKLLETSSSKLNYDHDMLDTKLKKKISESNELEKKVSFLENENIKLNLKSNEYEKQLIRAKENYEKKINKKNFKKNLLEKDNLNLKLQLEETSITLSEYINKIRHIENEQQKNCNKISEEEINNYIKQILNLSLKLKLSLDTINMIISCRSCTENHNKFYVINCGHSICHSCIELNKGCTDCNKSDSKINLTNYFPIENINLNNIATRFKFANHLTQDIDSIANLIREKINQ